MWGWVNVRYFRYYCEFPAVPSLQRNRPLPLCLIPLLSSISTGNGNPAGHPRGLGPPSPPSPPPFFCPLSPQCCPLARLNRSQLTQEPANSPRWGRGRTNVNGSRATKDTKLPAEGGPQILPARAEPPTQPPKLMDDSERRRSTWAPHQHPEEGAHPTLLKRSSRVAAGPWAAVSPSHRAARTGHLRSRAPRTASAKRCSPAPRRNEEGPCRSQSPSGICCPGVIFVSHFPYSSLHQTGCSYANNLPLLS